MGEVAGLEAVRSIRALFCGGSTPGPVGKQPWNVSLLPSQSWGTTPVQIPDRCSNIEVEVGQGRVSREAS